MNDFADRFRARYPTLGSVCKSLAEGETPASLPAEWKSINYYAHVFSNDADAAVRAAAQAFLRETDVARLDTQAFTGRMMLATQAFAQAVCRAAGIAWKEEPVRRQRAASAPPKPSAKPKPKSSAQKPAPTTRAKSSGRKTR